jgi:hypothetical protein
MRRLAERHRSERPALTGSPRLSLPGRWGEALSRQRGIPLAAARLALAMPENSRAGTSRGSMDWQLRSKLKNPLLATRLMCQHNADSRRAHKGWPDWTIGGPGGVLFRELKAEGEDPSPEQAAWLAILSGNGLDACVWTAVDFLPLEAGVSRVDRELFTAAGLRIAGTSPVNTPVSPVREPPTAQRGIVDSHHISHERGGAAKAPQTAKGPLAEALNRSTTSYPVPESLAADQNHTPRSRGSS